ncbi:dihydroorotate dehydrogenase [Candidatus Woesearchaeota archaeon]|nr:dihydroorotate dehydrogenase [Candidatus Woesearchaeota archaeon]
MLKTSICGVKLENPTVLASGIMGVSGASLVNVSKNGAGAVTTKSIGLEERKGHPGPIMITTKHYGMNAVGLSNQGIKLSMPEVVYAIKNSRSPVIASIFARKVSEFGVLSKEISKTNPALIEANISCPNVEAEFGKPFATDPDAARDVTKEVVKNTKIPVIVKLSPNVANIAKIAKIVQKAGASTINAINTAGPGLAIDIRTKLPILSNKTGGISGPAIKPIAVKAVYDIYDSVKIPIIGTGGVISGEDAVEMMMAGASAVGIGTGVYYRGIDVFKKVSDEIKVFMKKEGYSNLKELIGAAHNV